MNANYISPSGSVFSIEQLGRLVSDWEDPNEAPVVEKYGNITVVNDGLFKYGSKARFIDKYVKECSAEEIVYASPTTGYAQISLSYVCSLYYKKAILFEPERGLDKLHEYQKRAQELGGKINWVKMGMSPVLKSHASRYVSKNENSVMAPFGFDNEIIVASIIKVAHSLNIEQPDEVWSVAGSGTLSRGLQLAFPNSEVYAVGVGHKLSERERGRANVIYHTLPFGRKTKDLPPFASAPTYDAKAWQYLKERKGRILFWNVGA